MLRRGRWKFYVRRIREKIEPDPENPRYLKTVRGAGYRLRSRVEKSHLR